MKHKLLSKSLLMAVGLFVGASTVWATETTTTYDFTGRTAGTTPTLSSSAHHKAGNTQNVFLATDEICDSRFAFQAVDNSTNHVFDYTKNNLQQLKGDRWFSIIDVKAGDKIKITFSVANAGSSTDKHFTIENAGTSSSTNLSLTSGGEAIAANTDMISGTTYYVLADGYIDFKTRKNFYLSKVEITSIVSSEEVSSPKIKISGVQGTARNITITSGSSNLSNPITTYYTTDGTDPTTSSPSFTEANKVITIGEGSSEEETVTIKAISISSTTVESSLAILDATIGTTIQLTAPTFTKKNYNNGIYSVAITADQAGLTIVPSSYTIYYSINGGDPIAYSTELHLSTGTELSAFTTSDGYDNSNTSNVTIVARPAFVENWSINFAGQATADKGEVTVSDSAFAANTISFGTITANGLTSNNNFGVKTETKWLLRNTGNKGLYSFNGGSTPIAIANLVENQFVVINCKDQAQEFKSVTGGSNMTEYGTTGQIVLKATADGNMFINLGRYIYIQSIYVYDLAEEQTVSVSEAGFATYVNKESALDFTSASIEAYTVKVTEPGVATLTQVYEVPANAPVLLYAEGGATENIPVIASAAALENNDLVAGTGAAVATEVGDYTNMILWRDETNPIGFYFANDQEVATNRAYLHFASSLAPAANAPMAIQFSDEVTGIEQVNAAESAAACFNLAGQRVAKATKGLYILNGKKVLVK